MSDAAATEQARRGQRHRYGQHVRVVWVVEKMSSAFRWQPYEFFFRKVDAEKRLSELKRERPKASFRTFKYFPAHKRAS